MSLPTILGDVHLVTVIQIRYVASAKQCLRRLVHQALRDDASGSVTILSLCSSWASYSAPSKTVLLYAALHLVLLYLWQIDLLRLHHLARIARTAGLWVMSEDLPAAQLIPQVLHEATPRFDCYGIAQWHGHRCRPSAICVTPLVCSPELTPLLCSPEQSALDCSCNQSSNHAAT